MVIMCVRTFLTFQGEQKMKTLKAVIVIAGLAAGSVSARDFSFVGSIQSNEVQPFFFSVTSPSMVTLETLSNAGGTNASGTIIAGGGFDPIITLFDAISGNEITYSDDGPSGLDSFIETYLDSGNYLATVTRYSNFAIGPSLSDGFWGNNFSGQDSHYALDILNVSNAALGVSFNSVSPIPEPQTYAMLLAGLGLFGFVARRRKQML
jgi:hypothetical protein